MHFDIHPILTLSLRLKILLKIIHVYVNNQDGTLSMTIFIRSYEIVVCFVYIICFKPLNVKRKYLLHLILKHKHCY